MNIKKIILILLLLISIYFYRDVLVYRPLMNVISLNQTTGIIIGTKDVQRRGHITGAFNYYYQFSLNDKEYSNPSYDEKYKIGDTVFIEYSKNFPFMNRIKINSNE